MVCNVEKEMIKGRKVIKQMLNKKYNFPLNKVVVVPGRITHTILSYSRAGRHSVPVHLPPRKKKKPTPPRES